MSSHQSHNDVLIRVDHVSKKFCRDFKRSLIYGVQELGSRILGIQPNRSKLKKNEFWAVRDVSFELKRGECLGLIGHNGSGKSTLLKMLNGLISPDEGRIEINGKVGALIELGAGFNPLLTGKENVYINGQILGFSRKEIDARYAAIVAFAELEDFMEAPVRGYSSGMKVRLGFSIAAQMEPDILIIDEVLAVGDVGFRTKCMNRINELISKSAVIFVSHSMPLIARIVTDLILMEKSMVFVSGKNIHEGIERYLNLFQHQKQNTTGSGLATITNARFSTGDQYLYGEPIMLSFDVSKKDFVRIFNIVIMISNREMIQVASVYSRSDCLPFSRTGKVDVSFKNLFTPGQYTIHIGLVESFDDDNRRVGEIYCMQNNVLEFNSQDTTVFSHVPIRLVGEWSLK